MNKTVQKVATWIMLLIMIGGVVAMVLAYLIK